MGVFNSMLANVYGRLSAAFGDQLDQRAFKYTVNVFYVALLRSAQDTSNSMFFSLYKIYPLS